MFLLIAAIMVSALCLRAPITGVGALIGDISKDTGLAAGQAGLITTVPLLVFAVLSVLIGRIADRIGAGGCMFNCTLLMCIGILIRSFHGAVGLFAGTILIGVGIAAGNVLIAAIVKAYFPNRVGLMTGIYASLMSIAGGISSGISAPVAEGWGWRAALLMWAALAGCAALLWIPVLSCSTDGKLPEGGLKRTFRAAAVRRNTAMASLAHHAPLRRRRQRRSSRDYRPPVSRSRMAWAIVFYFGIQSLVFYTFVAWMPSIMQAKGFDAEVSGFYTSLFILVGIPATLFAPVFTEREGDECKFNIMLGLMIAIGILFILVGGSAPLLLIGTVSCGLAAGACFSQSMALFALRTRDAHDAAELSGLAQSVGYLIAAAGPAIAGLLFDLSGSWTPALILMILLGIAEAALGNVVGREEMI